jgi:hypothetical protein
LIMNSPSFGPVGRGQVRAAEQGSDTSFLAPVGQSVYGTKVQR